MAGERKKNMTALNLLVLMLLLQEKQKRSNEKITSGNANKIKSLHVECFISSFSFLKSLFYIVRTQVFSQRLSRSCKVCENYNEGVTADTIMVQTTLIL